MESVIRNKSFEREEDEQGELHNSAAALFLDKEVFHQQVILHYNIEHDRLVFRLLWTSTIQTEESKQGVPSENESCDPNGRKQLSRSVRE